MNISSSKQIVDKVAEVDPTGFGVGKLVDGQQVMLETNLTQDQAMELISKDADCKLAVWWKEFWKLII